MKLTSQLVVHRPIALTAVAVVLKPADPLRKTRNGEAGCSGKEVDVKVQAPPARPAPLRLTRRASPQPANGENWI
jgi:hypothetical protein